MSQKNGTFSQTRKLLTDDQDGVHIRVLEKLSADRVNVLLVVGNTAVGDGVLAVTGKSSAVTVRKIVNDKDTGNGWVSTSRVLGLDVCQVSAHSRDLSSSVPEEKSVIGHQT